uniref:Transposase n=1 Tax=Steinernema glaseri TaxID=37863 RepID=A0A1I8A209_9BILA
MHLNLLQCTSLDWRTDYLGAVMPTRLKNAVDNSIGITARMWFEASAQSGLTPTSQGYLRNGHVKPSR